MHRIVITIYLIISSLVTAGEFRIWSNADKTKTFEGEFVSCKDDKVTLRLKNFKQFTMEMDKLHQDDQAWIKQNHPASGTSTTNKNLKPINQDAVFDTLVFGDNRETVTKKLFESKLVTASVSSEHIGRTGLNNVFQTREKIGGLKHSLTFDWSEDGGLIEVTLQSEDVSLADYSSTLKPCWLELKNFIISIYGNPKSSGELPNPTQLENDKMLTSHLWRLEQGGSILLGSSKIDDSYQAVVRFTKGVYP